MKKQSILFLLILALVLLCSCSNNAQSSFKNTDEFSYKEAVQVDYKSLHNTSALLMFKSSTDNKELGELYIKPFDGNEEKIASNVCKDQYDLLNNNDVVYIDADNNLYLKKYGQDAIKIDKNVPYDSVYISSINTISYRTYEDDNFLEDYDSQYKDIFLNDKGDTYVIYDSKTSNSYGYSYYYFSEDGKILFLLNDFGTLSKMDLEGKIENLAGNVSSFSATQDGSAFAYNTHNNRLYIRWAGAQKSSYIKNLDVNDDFQISNNGLSCIFTAYDDEGESNLMFVTPFSEPVSITKNNNGNRAILNNDYVYILDKDDKLYGYKLPEITAKTEPENLSKQLDDIKGVLLGSGIKYYAISNDGKSASYINSKDELYTSYDLSEAVKICDNAINIEYINNAIVFQDKNSKLFVNAAYNDIDKASGSNTEVCSNSEYFYVENTSLDYFIYMDENSYIYTYGVGQKSKLIIDNVEEYTSAIGRYANLYVKALSMDDIAGMYSCENLSNSYDMFVVGITKDDITLIFDDHSSISDITVTDSTESSISLEDEEGYNYTIYKDNENLSLEIYDDEMNSYYQYNIENISEDKFNEKLEKAKLEMKYNAVYYLIEEYYNNDYPATEDLPMYYEHSLNSEVIGNIVAGDVYYVQNYYVEDDYNFWLNIEYSDGEGNYGYAWIYIDTSNLSIEN